MFIVDIETVGTRSSSGILSLAIAHFDVDESKHNLDYLEEHSLLLKFDLKNQFDEFNRTFEQETLDWWMKQSKEVRSQSLIPSEQDILIVDGMKQINEFIKNHCQKVKDEYFWSRGQLDPMIIEDCYKVVGVPPMQPSFWMWRDIRTAIHLLYNSPRGYCEIDYPKNQQHVEQLKNLKHDPKADIFLDVLQLFYGVSNG